MTGKDQRRAFTLIELLVVIGILAIIITIALPAFQGLGRGTSMQTAVAELRTTLNLARQWAITRHEETYVLFPDDGVTYDPPDTVDKAFRAYAVYTASAGYIGEWRYLPPGLVLDPLYDPRGTSEKNLLKIPNALQSVGFPDQGSFQDLYCVVYEPDGRVSYGASSEIIVTEGQQDVDFTSGLASPPIVNPNAGRTIMSLEVHALTGQVRIREYTGNP